MLLKSHISRCKGSYTTGERTQIPPESQHIRTASWPSLSSGHLLLNSKWLQSPYTEVCISGCDECAVPWGWQPSSPLPKHRHPKAGKDNKKTSRPCKHCSSEALVEFTRAWIKTTPEIWQKQKQTGKVKTGQRLNEAKRHGWRTGLNFTVWGKTHQLHRAEMFSETGTCSP